MSYLREHFDDGLPAAQEPFDADELPGFAEGDWPTWPKQGMLEWLPPSVQELGTVKDTLLTGSFLHLDHDRQDEVIEALAAEGIECREYTEDLVVRACGEWRYTYSALSSWLKFGMMSHGTNWTSQGGVGVDRRGA